MNSRCYDGGFTCSPNSSTCLIQHFLIIFLKFSRDSWNNDQTLSMFTTTSSQAFLFFDALLKHTLYFCFLDQQFNITLLVCVLIRDVRPSSSKTEIAKIFKSRPKPLVKDRFLYKTNTALLEKVVYLKKQIFVKIRDFMSWKSLCLYQKKFS